MIGKILISGGTGYLGRVLTRKLIARGHSVLVLARKGSESKVTAPAQIFIGDALQGNSFVKSLEPGMTLVHLTGTPHPAPWKEREFRAIDLVSLRESAAAAQAAGVGHFVYVSVAQPAPVMRAYLQVRSECEAILANTNLPRTILRPWYVLGPGHRWPEVLRPFYSLLEAIPATRDGARRLGLVTLEEMTSALVWAVEHPVAGAQTLDVVQIREKARSIGD